MRLGIALLGLLILTGCSAKYDLAGTAWAKPNTLVQQATLDEIDCAREAREASSHSRPHRRRSGRRRPLLLRGAAALRHVRAAA